MDNVYTGLANGTRGICIAIIFLPGNGGSIPDYVVMYFPDYRWASCVAGAWYLLLQYFVFSGQTMHSAMPGVFPVGRKVSDKQVNSISASNGGVQYGHARTGIPLEPCKAFGVHKVFGLY